MQMCADSCPFCTFLACTCMVSVLYSYVWFNTGLVYQKKIAKLTQVVKFRTHMLQVPNLEFYFAICELEDRSNTFGKL